MLITQVELHNTKSYRQQTVRFTEGTNAICGENGAGKTTLVEAIGFTLFDYLPNNHSALVREGEKTAAITVSFISSHDEREYQVVRRCGSSNQYYVYDPEIDVRLVTGKSDVTAWLRQHLGVDASTDLTGLFRDALGVPQGLLTATFLQQPGQRKPVFDRLLQVDEYAQAFVNSRETISYFKDQIGQAAVRIASLEAAVGRLPDLRGQVQALEREITTLDQRLGILITELSQVSQRRQELETAAQTVTSLVQEMDRCQSRLETLADRLVTTEKAAEQSRQAQAELEQSRPGYETYLAAQEVTSQLEQERAQKEKLLADSASMKTAQARSLTRIEQLEADLLAIGRAQQQLAALTPQVTQQTDLETKREQLRQTIVTLQQLSKQRYDQQQELTRLEEQMTRIEAGLSAAGSLEKTQKADQESLAAVQTRRLELTRLLAGLEAEKNRVAQQAQALGQTETARCPVCEQPLTSEHRQNLLEENRSRQATLQQQMAELQAESVERIKSERNLNRSIEAAVQQLRQLPRPEDRAELEKRSSTLMEKLEAVEAEISSHTGAETTLAQVEANLNRLDDPRRQHDLLTAQIAKESVLLEQLGVEQQTVAGIRGKLRDIETSLAPFFDLDDRTGQHRQVLSQSLEDYQRYLSSSRVAAELPTRQREAEALSNQVAAAEAQLATAHSQLEAATAGFNQVELEQVRQRETALNREQATGEGQLVSLGRQLDYAGNELAGLENKERDLADEHKLQSERQNVLTLFQLFREAIRDAGPHVIRRLVQMVSLQATRLYAAILADHTCRLTWHEDYSIHMEKDGRTREFAMLSGGEQMAAALSIRLALLKELSAIDVVFFDEPTSNLDETRRENLAEQIAAVRNTGFSQIFVISHDDTFEQATDHIVRVVKQNGESRTESG